MEDIHCVNCREDSNFLYNCSRARYDWYKCGNCGEDITVSNTYRRMKLEDQFRQNLLGQLSSDKTEVDVAIASKIVREFAIGFAEFARGLLLSKEDGTSLWNYDAKWITTKALLEIYEKTYYNSNM